MLTPKAVLDLAVDAWNSTNEEALLALATADIDVTAPAGPSTRGRARLRSWLRIWTEAARDHRVRILSVASAPYQLIYEGLCEGTHTGVLRLPTGDIPPTGRTMVVGCTGLIRLTGDRISYLRHYLDMTALAAQPAVRRTEGPEIRHYPFAEAAVQRAAVSVFRRS
ncbi:MAG TPA: nuclear transport factor 2 family protein [Candidatus Dormibacteraeota bacterium]